MTDDLALKQYPTVEQAIAAKFSQPHYITLFEVRDATGFDSSRSADAIAIGMYRSRGREIIGFEIKTARSDWLREMKQPEKAERIGKFCDWFYLVTNDESVARTEELPLTWGWMVLKGERLKIVKKPERIQAATLDRNMICSLLYATRKQAVEEFDTLVKERVEQRLKEHDSSVEYQLQQAHDTSKNLRKQIDEFEQASGLSIRWGDQAKIGDAVKRFMAQENAVEKYKDELKWVLSRATSLAKTVEQELAKINGGESTP